MKERVMSPSNPGVKLLYTSIGPNPRVVNMFIAEKGLTLPTRVIDIVAGENRAAEYRKLNPAAQSPALELSDGSVLTETTAICRYLEALYPQPSLFGGTAREVAETDMWSRRLDLQIIEPLVLAFRGAEGHALFKDRCYVMPTAAPELKAYAQSGLTWLNEQMAGRTYLCGDRFTYADIQLFCFVDLGNQVGQPLNAAHANLQGWFERVAARPSVKASLV
jgi:glutathione S-transferase